MPFWRFDVAVQYFEELKKNKKSKYIKHIERNDVLFKCK